MGKVYWITLVLLLIVAGLLAAIPLRYSHDWDESVFLQHARIFLDGRSNYDELHHRPPVLSLLYALGYALWDNPHSPHVLQGVLTGATVLFAFLYAKRAFGTAPALLAAVLFGINPYFVDAAHQLLTDVPSLGFMLAAMWFYDGPGARQVAAAGVAWAIAVQTRFTSSFLLVYFLLDTALAPRTKLPRLILLGISVLVAIAPYLLWAKWKFGGFFYPMIHARRIVMEWTAAVPATMYWNGLLELFPASLLVLFALGTATLARRIWRQARVAGILPALAALDQTDRRLVVLVLWGIAFLVYMCGIPHKEVRYLLPLGIPVVMLAAIASADILSWLKTRSQPWRTAALALTAIAIAADYAPALRSLGEPWIDDSKRESVQIAEYLRAGAAPNDVIYAAHFFPVLAFYSAHKTESLLPYQSEFEQVWRNVMAKPGYLVYYPPAGIGETHAVNSHFKPDQAFIDAHPEFHFERDFPSARIYRYEPGR